MTFYLKVIAIILAMVQPFILMSCFGELNSLSAYWDTSGQPLFIITNATTSYFLFSTKSWQVPALCLLGVTAFPFSEYHILHNVLAITFFAVALIPMIRLARFRYYLIPYMVGVCIVPQNLFYGEIVCIVTICLYHMHILLHIKKYALIKNIFNKIWIFGK